MKKLFILIVFVLAVVSIYYFGHAYICKENQLYSGFFGSILATLFAAILAWIVWEEWSKISTTSSADFINKLTKDFFTTKARTLLTLIECKALEFIIPDRISDAFEPQPYFKVNSDNLKKSNMPEDLINDLISMKYYTTWEIDESIINSLVDVGTLEGRGILDFYMVYIGFRYYLNVIWSCDEIRKYIQWMRDHLKPNSIEHATSHQLQYIAEKCIEYADPQLQCLPCKILWKIKRNTIRLLPPKAKKIDILTPDEKIKADFENKARIKDQVFETTNNTLPHNGVFTRLRPSMIHGVGVFAIKDIPKDTNIFTGDNSKMVWVNKGEIEKQEPAIRDLYDDFCIIQGNKYYCPDNFNNLSVGWYLNESKDNPNVGCDDNYDFYALRDIKKDEELTVDYSTFSEYPHEQ